LRRNLINIALIAAICTGCRGLHDDRKNKWQKPDKDTTDTATTDDTDDKPTDTDTDTTTDTDTDTDTTPIPEDCTLPPAPNGWDYLSWVQPSEEFTFDAQGNLVNIDEVAGWIFETPWGGPAGLIAPYNATEIAAVRFMLDGDLAVADEANGALRRVGLDGAQDTLLGGLNNPNSVAVHSDGFVYTTAFDEVYRVDPSNGASTRLFRVPGADLDGLVFSPNFDLLYFNSDETGQVASIEVDEYGVGGAIDNLATLSLGWDEQLDGMAMDRCSNLYVIRTDGRVFRIQPDKTVESLIQLTRPGPLKATSLHFGSGVGGWELDHLYVMNREGGMWELDIGMEGAVPAHLIP